VAKQDDPSAQVATVAKHNAVLLRAFALAQAMAATQPMAVREIVATATVQGLDKNLDFMTASVSYRAEKYKRTWLVPSSPTMVRHAA